MPTLLFWSGSPGREEQGQERLDPRGAPDTGRKGGERRWTKSCSSRSSRSWSRCGLELVDVERRASVLLVTVDRAGGVDLDALTAANRAVSRALDELDPIPGRYSLEVSSPGVERRLRTPAHFARAVGEMVAVKTRPQVPGERRLRGRLVAADDEGFEVASRRRRANTTATADDEDDRAIACVSPTRTSTAPAPCSTGARQPAATGDKGDKGDRARAGRPAATAGRAGRARRRDQRGSRS